MDAISSRSVSPLLVLTLVASLLVSYLPSQIHSQGFQSVKVNGFWDSLFGSSEPEEAPSLDEVSTRIFLDLEFIDGESTEVNHLNWIELSSITFGMSEPGLSTDISRRRGDVVLEDILITKYVDKSTPKLMEACAKGTVFTSVNIDIAKDVDGEPVVYLRYELKMARVTAYQQVASIDKEHVEDLFAINYEEIKVVYTETDDEGKAKGNVEFSWKVEEGES